jgi:dihydrofolate synthase/folylpolyglutamate synthase
MDYQETLKYLYTSTPLFQHKGIAAYKPGLGNSITLDNYFGNPHRSYHTIHVGGTNGKGSVCHTLAAILQEAGYRVGLYTSPHLINFRERIRVNGQMITEEYVTAFVEQHRPFFEPLYPSFFELTTAMAFDYFRAEKVDIAVIEVGLGGRLDCTNIITPILSVITNISLDHTALLGDTLGEIAYEKAGIIKAGVPVVTGEFAAKIVAEVFRKKAASVNAPLFFAKRVDVLANLKAPILDINNKFLCMDTQDFGRLDYALKEGPGQYHNMVTMLTALRVLNESKQLKRLDQAIVAAGVKNVIELTGMHGRWECLWESPLVIADTGHNPDAWEHLRVNINRYSSRRRAHVVIGFSNDKDIDEIVQSLPEEAVFYFTQAISERAMPVERVAASARAAGVTGGLYSSVSDALLAAIHRAGPKGFVFIGGSHFVVAEAIDLFNQMKTNTLTITNK